MFGVGWVGCVHNSEDATTFFYQFAVNDLVSLYARSSLPEEVAISSYSMNATLRHLAHLPGETMCTISCRVDFSKGGCTDSHPKAEPDQSHDRSR